jgi:hypothetical protein
MARQPKTEPEHSEVYCLYHKMKRCICIHPVTTEEKLEGRIKNAEVINKYRRQLGFKPI